MPPQQIKKLLDSRHEREVLDGLRRVIAMQYAQPPQPTLTFFPAVLKTLSNPYPSTRPLVYNYLVHHSEQDPDTALLAINTIQKSLSDSNPRVRALALKTMSGIRVPVISQIVSLAIKKGITDLSPIVRKAAALACVKCVRLDSTTRPQVEDYIAALLADKQYYVAGAAVQAFMEICSERLDLIHPIYRRLCRMVVDMDEWGQLALLKLMTGYARRSFPQRTKKVKRAQTREEKARDFYEDLEAKEEEEEHDYDEIEITDPDLELFLKSTQPLLQSRNSAVIVSVARAYLYLAPTTYLEQAIGPLIALLRAPDDVQQVALYSIVQVCLQSPESFVPYVRHFLIRSSEAPAIRTLKLEVLTLTFPHSSKEHQDLILAELEHFSHSHDADLVREAVKAIGRCAQSSSEQTSRRCMGLLMKQLHSSEQHLVGEAMTVVRHLIQRDPLEHRKTVVRLAKNLDTLTSPTARACVVWLVGEFAGAEAESEGSGIAADVLRILVKGYVQESDEVRAQIVLLAAKVYLHHLNRKNSKQKALEALDSSTGEANIDEVNSIPDKPSQITLLYNHTLLLARYTPSYSLRDRARTYRALLALPSSTELASLLLLGPKPVPSAPSPSESRRTYTLGSASLVIGAQMSGYEGVPEWVREGEAPDAKARDEGDGAMDVGGGGRVAPYAAASKAVSAGQRLDEALVAADPGYSGGKVRKEKSLDAWLDEEEESESESEEDDNDEEEDDAEEESEYETDSEDDSGEEEESESEGDERKRLVGR